MHADRRDAAARTVLLAACVAGCAAGGLPGCGRDSAELVPIRLLHSPAVGQLTPQQLQALSRECEKYPSNGWARGRYDAAYCEEVIAAWGDSPIQMVIVGPAKTP